MNKTFRSLILIHFTELFSQILSADGSALPEPVNCNNFIGFKVIREDLEALSIIHGGSATGYEVSNYTVSISNLYNITCKVVVGQQIL